MTLLLMPAAGRECAHTAFCRQREMCSLIFCAVIIILWGIMQGSGICMGIMHQVSMHEIELQKQRYNVSHA